MTCRGRGGVGVHAAVVGWVRIRGVGLPVVAQLDHSRGGHHCWPRPNQQHGHEYLLKGTGKRWAVSAATALPDECSHVYLWTPQAKSAVVQRSRWSNCGRPEQHELAGVVTVGGRRIAPARLSEFTAAASNKNTGSTVLACAVAAASCLSSVWLRGVTRGRRLQIVTQMNNRPRPAGCFLTARARQGHVPDPSVQRAVVARFFHSCGQSLFSGIT